MKKAKAGRKAREFFGIYAIDPRLWRQRRFRTLKTAEAFQKKHYMELRTYIGKVQEVLPAKRRGKV